jgi:hypothetical protein
MSINTQEEQMIHLGDLAEQLIQSEAFTETINSLVEATFQTFVNSAPEQEDDRQRAYTHYRALVDITNTLRQRVSIRDEINAKHDGDNNQTDEEES